MAEVSISLASVAARLGVATRTVRRQVDRGEIPAHYVGRRVVFYWSEVQAATRRAPRGKREL